MAAPRKNPDSKSTEHVSAKLTPPEKHALEQLLALRAAALADRGEPPDASFAGWLRWTIRQQAKAAGVQVDAPPAAPRRT